MQPARNGHAADRVEPAVASRVARAAGARRQPVLQRSRPLHLLLIILLLQLLPGGADQQSQAASTAADSASPPEHLGFKRLLPDRGLPEAEVRAIHQDRRGFMWFATYDGLVRFDGHEFLSFRNDPEDPQSLADNVVWDILEEASGALWLATWGGLDRLDPVTRRFTHHRSTEADTNSLSSNLVRVLEPAADGRIWVGTGRGLNLFDPRTGIARRFLAASGPAQQALPDDSIRALLVDRTGRLWIGSDNGGLTRYEPATGNFTHFRHDPSNPTSLNHGRVTALAEDQQGTLWVGTDFGVGRLEDAASGRFRRFTPAPGTPGALQSALIDTLHVGRNGLLWVGVDGSGLHCLRPGTDRFVHYDYRKQDSLTPASPVVRAIREDAQGDLWLAHFPSGVSYANQLNAPFRGRRTDLALPENPVGESVGPILESVKGDLYIGTQAGLNHFDPAAGRWTLHPPHAGEGVGSLTSHVLSILEDHRGEIWLGTWNGGLSRFHPATGRFDHFPAQPAAITGLNNPHPWTLAEDASRRIWVGTRGGGINVLDANRTGFTHVLHDPTDPQSLNHDIVWRLLFGRDGTLWAGTLMGLGRLDPGAGNRWRRYQAHQQPGASLSHNFVVDVLEDRQGILWIATEGGGLNRLDPAAHRVQVFRRREGFPSDVVRGLIEDAQGSIWASTSVGLVQFDPRQPKPEFHVYDGDHGVLASQLVRGSHALLRTGDLLFGAAEGYTQVAPSRLVRNPHKPEVYITRFDIFNEPILPDRPGSPLARAIEDTGRIEIPSSQSAIGFTFAGLSYRAPHHNQYAYRLEGFDTTWHTAGAERRATYTNLDPGKYRLRVKAANNEGVWNERERVLELVIIPPWWGTVGFRLAATALVTALVAGAGAFVSHSRSRARLRESERERVAAVEKQRATEALRESESRYRTVLENANDAIVIAQNGVFRSTNRRMAQLLGYSMTEIADQSFARFIHPDDVALVLQRHRERFSGNLSIPTSYRFRLVRKDGTAFWVELNTTIVRWEGQPATLNVLRDISERHKAEQALESLTTLHTAILESAGHAIVATTPSGIITVFNRAAQRILGYDAEEMIGQATPAVFHDPEEVGTRARQLSVELGQPIEPGFETFVARTRHDLSNEQEWTYVRKDGSRFPVLLTITALRDPQDHITGFLGVAVDITERKRAAEALRVSAAQLRATLENTPNVGIQWFDAAGRVVFWNRASELIYGWTSAQALGRTLDQLIHTPQEHAAFIEYLQTIRESGHAVGPYETTIHRRDKSRGIVLATTFAIPSGNADPLFVCMDVDITALREAEDQLRRLNASLESRVAERTAELHEANKELESFAYSVSHDLRSPLRAIDGFSHFLQTQYQGALDEKGRSHLEKIRLATRRMSALIDDLLSLSRTSRAPIQRSRVDLTALAQSILLEIREADPRREVEVCVAPNLEAHADPGLMRVVLDNLLRNAWKFTALQPRARIDFGLQHGPAGPMLFVRDNGVGFDMTHASKLFGMFQRLHHIDQFPGTGIGLATVHRILQRHGGRIWAEAAPDRGACFFFTIPSPSAPSSPA